MKLHLLECGVALAAALIASDAQAAGKVDLPPQGPSFLSPAQAATSSFKPVTIKGMSFTGAEKAGAVIGFTVNLVQNQIYQFSVDYVAPLGAVLVVRANGSLVGNLKLAATSNVSSSSKIDLKLVKGGNAFSLTDLNGDLIGVASVHFDTASGPSATPVPMPTATPPPISYAPPVLANPGPEDYVMTFEDRFRDRELDRDKWRPFNTEYPTFGPSHCVAGTAGCATSQMVLFGQTIDVSGTYNTLFSPKNVELTGSGLVLRADNIPLNRPKVNNGPQSLFTSGWIDTYGNFSQTYGFFEMRARMPPGQGFWPAFWLMPQDRQWSYEVDIFEILTGNNGADRANTGPHSVHLGLLWNNGKGNVGAWYKNKDLDVTTGFHVYGLLWKPDSLTYFVDGMPVQTASAAAGAQIPQIPMYMIANLSVGGAWGGYPDLTTDFSRGMEIDYIRAYQYKGAPLFTGEAAFPVLMDKVSPNMVTTVAGAAVNFNIAVNSSIVSNGSYSISYSLANVAKDPVTLNANGTDKLGGTVKSMQLKPGVQSYDISISIPSNFPAGLYALKARVVDAKTGKYNNGATVAVLELK